MYDKPLEHGMRAQILECDRRNMLDVLYQLHLFTGRLLSNHEPNIYVLDLLPELSAATTSLLLSTGLVKDRQVLTSNLTQSRLRLLGCFDSLLDESQCRSVDWRRPTK